MTLNREKATFFVVRRQKVTGEWGGRGEGERARDRGGEETGGERRRGCREEDLSREGGKAFTQAWGERRSIA